MKLILRSQWHKGPAHWVTHREGTEFLVPLEDWRTRGVVPHPLPTHVSRQSNCSLSTTFHLIRLFFTGAVLIKGLLSTQNICSEVLLWLLMMPWIIKSGRNFQLRFAWSFLPAPCPSSPHSAPISAFTHLPSFLGMVTLLETDLGKQSARIKIQGIKS